MYLLFKNSEFFTKTYTLPNEDKESEHNSAKGKNTVKKKLACNKLVFSQKYQTTSHTLSFFRYILLRMIITFNSFSAFIKTFNQAKRFYLE